MPRAERRLWPIPKLWARSPPPPVTDYGPPEPCLDHGPFACDEVGCPVQSLVPHGGGIGVRGSGSSQRNWARYNSRDHFHEPPGIPKTKLHGHVICWDLRSACNLTFDNVWKTPPPMTSDKKIWELCFKTCNSTAAICKTAAAHHSPDQLAAAPLDEVQKEVWNSVFVSSDPQDMWRQNDGLESSFASVGSSSFAVGILGGMTLPLALFAALWCRRGDGSPRTRMGFRPKHGGGPPRLAPVSSGSFSTESKGSVRIRGIYSR